MRQPSSAPEPATPRLAASVIVLRPAAPQGMEVLMIERPANARSFAGALVFPGGRLEPGDEALVWHGRSDRAVLTPLPSIADAGTTAALYGAAMRETLEEVGLLWPAPGCPFAGAGLAALRQELAGGRSWQSLQTHRPPALQGEALLPFSRWITPSQPHFTTSRFDTWFFLAEMPAGQQACADGREALHAVWASPGEFLQRHAQGTAMLAPPQLMTLLHLAGFADIASLQAFARHQPPYCVAPVGGSDAGIPMVCFPGDPLHSQAMAVMPGPRRLLLRQGRFLPLEGMERWLAARTAGDAGMHSS